MSMGRKLWKIRSEKLSGMQVHKRFKSLDISTSCSLFNGLPMEEIFKEIISCNFKKPVRRETVFWQLVGTLKTKYL